MKTILVIYTDKKNPSSKEITQSRKYAFRTEESIEVGDILESKNYSTNMYVTDVLDKEYKYINFSTGDLKEEITSAKDTPIRILKFGEEDVIYCNKV